MVLYKNKAPIIKEKGKYIPMNYTTQIRRDLEGEIEFGSLMSCLGEGWLKEDQEGEEYLDVEEYLQGWGTKYFQVSRTLTKLLGL